MRHRAASDGGVPHCIQPELVEGCSMSAGSGAGGLCHFCGIAAIRSGPGNYKYMALDLAEKLARDVGQFCPHARIEYAMRGEPLMHPKHLDIFRLFRKHAPKAQQMCTTNGDTLRTPSGRPYGRMQQQLERMFEAGLDFVLLDTYYPKERRDALRDEAYALHGITIADYYDDWMPVGRSPYHNHGRKVQRTVLLMDDLAARDGEHPSRVIKTHAGSNPNKPLPMIPLARNCGRPFREMTIAWNGDVTLCCDDWRHEYVCGNVVATSLSAIWVGERFEAARARLADKDRDFGPCRLCDAPSAPRSGLLPQYAPATPAQKALTDQIGAESAHLIPIWKLTRRKD